MSWVFFMVIFFLFDTHLSTPLNEEMMCFSYECEFKGLNDLLMMLLFGAARTSSLRLCSIELSHSYNENP